MSIDGIDRVTDKLDHFFDDMAEDLKLAGEQAAEAIVQTTLAGIGEDDKPFAPYSPAYQATIDAVGGKSIRGGNVDLRGVFYHDGQDGPSTPARLKTRQAREKHDSSQRAKGARRAAYVTVRINNRSFTAKTRLTRPMLGLTDPQSEMSLDLITVQSTDSRLTITYGPRSQDYMITHNDGDGKMPRRRWFTARKSAVMHQMMSVLKTGLAARAAYFNARQ